MPTLAAALACPTGDLRLAHCTTCGFISNLAFDSASQELTARYEATQGFSPTFTAFARSLVEGWARRFALRGKRALEIGCGRGEFIRLLCEVGGCEGVGIDPVLSPADIEAAGNVRLIADYYSERFTDLDADFICCRHTLEHIPRTADFVLMVRRAIGERRDTVVCFEVPDTLRVLREGAFWDLYYEHCSYFTPRSLARLFRRSGFEVMEVRREFDGQYLVIEARPGDGGAGKGAKFSEDGSAETSAAVADFQRAGAEGVRRWTNVLQTARAHGRRVALWGSGSKAVGFLTTLGAGIELVPLVVDINPNKQGTFLPGTGQEIVAPARLRDERPDVVIAMNPAYRREIERDLRAMGAAAELLTL